MIHTYWDSDLNDALMVVQMESPTNKGIVFVKCSKD